MSTQGLTHVLIESFNALADEVQSLGDRQTVLEHKLRFAHEQFQYIADKYAPAAPEIAETLVKLQLPPELNDPSLADSSAVPLPRRKASNSKHQIAIVIREGRKVASALSSPSKSSRSSRGSAAPTTMTSLSTILEQDFTVEGKTRGTLRCPFSQAPTPQNEDGREAAHQAQDGHHDAEDPICAAMFDEAGSPPASAAASKCPIRYLDQHSPEEIAHYLETHKHELPRSHEVCVRRYQRNEDDIRKLDAKYGNLVSMVEGLSRIHQPMLPEQDTRPQSDVERGSNDRVETWAQTVSVSLSDDADQTALEGDSTDEERQSHFDRPLKEVRVGESPSRPWGISVPFVDVPAGFDGRQPERPESPPPAPVHMPADHPTPETPAKQSGAGKCPFDHTKMAQMMGGKTPQKPEDSRDASHMLHTPAAAAGRRNHDMTPRGEDHTMEDEQQFQPDHQTPDYRRTMPLDSGIGLHQQHAQQPQPRYGMGQPTFLHASGLNRPDFGQEHQGQPAPPPPPPPQMVFTGPVFIGYPMEHAIQFMQQFQGQQQQQQQQRPL
ncbi:uncharacterized protein B0I36DRAFT_360477 [Microdochium trichocladiopsis]|uniref:Uncharacterized protein n=1 Tax=Microdochium trichocladiopsis TaxID=1682393 RepID=A0A9P8YBV6_9PEZI|nr:uncharacterized protein B0I36DRAFT_360477 [Microdochium trichocladiopsis]KAH7035030.1 hypothetical protein B0I36DRAFT_360477 [Microdochium trichocladiopsis]